MKLLFDQNLSLRLCRQVTDLSPQSAGVRLRGLAEASDHTVWQCARADGFVLVSQDADFAEMAALLGPPPKVIWLRCGNQPTAAIEKLLRDRADSIAIFEHDDAAACLEIYWGQLWPVLADNRLFHGGP